MFSLVKTKKTKAENVKSFHFGNELLLPNQPHHDTFLRFMAKVLKRARFFGVAGSGGMLWHLLGAIVFILLLVIECGATVKVIRALAGWARDTANQRSVAARFAGAMFYAAALISQILCWRLSYQWQALSKYWASVEWLLNVKYVPSDATLKRRLIAVTAFMTTCAAVEHVMSILATTGLDCPVSDIVKTYILKSHGFLLLDKEYYDIISLPVLFVSNVATMLWNLQDILLVLISMGLTSRYVRLNGGVATMCSKLNKEQKWSKDKDILQVYLWRKIREAYVKQALLVRKINDALGLILLFSNFFSFYFICLQLFLWITQGFEGDFFQKVYSLVALCWICVRTCCVVLAAADIYEKSKSALPYLYACHAEFYNIEIERLQNQLEKDYIALSGMGFFNLTRTVLLQEFLPTMSSIFVLAKTFGIPTFGGRTALLSALAMLGMLIALEICSIWKLFRTLNGSSLNPNGSVTARLSGSIFYGNCLLSMAITWKLARRWRALSKFWLKMETKCGLEFPPDTRIRRRVIFVASFVAVCAIVEHMLSMMSATGFDCPPREYLQRYILSSHGFLVTQHEYSLWLAIPIFILSKLATVLWNFQDLIIILMSMGLTSRYNRLNVFVQRVVTFENEMKSHCILERHLVARVHVWRRLRTAFVHQAQLVKKVDQCLGGLILLSNLNNLYFICLQLFLGISSERGTAINRIYYLYSLCWLLFRASGVLLAAGDVQLHSKRALHSLYSCAGAAYNIEIKRLTYELEHETISLSGMAFFHLSREELLEVVGAIVKYELILLQYDKDKN